MVIPCSRSARRPSVAKLRLSEDCPLARLAISSACSWSSVSWSASCSSRPTAGSAPARRSRWRSKVALPLAVLHRALGEAVVAPRRPALTDPRRGDLGDHLVDRRRPRAHGSGAGGGADGPGAHAELLRNFAGT